MNLSPLTLCFVLLLSEAICGLFVLLAVRYAVAGMMAPLTQQTTAVAAAVASLSVTQRATTATLEMMRKQMEGQKSSTGWGQAG